MRMRMALAAAATAITAGTLSYAVPASAVTAASPAATEKYYFSGQIHALGHSAWCLTVPHGVADGDQIFVARCAAGDGSQLWFGSGLGGSVHAITGTITSLAGDVPFEVGQRGTSTSMIAVNENTDPASTHYLLKMYQRHDTSWNISVNYKNLVMAFPESLPLHKLFLMNWISTMSKSRNYGIILPAWHLEK